MERSVLFQVFFRIFDNMKQKDSDKDELSGDRLAGGVAQHHV